MSFTDWLADKPGILVLIGDRLQTRQIDNEFNELMLKSAILNRMTHLGMPESVKVVG
jgi:hypothetical protein